MTNGTLCSYRSVSGKSLSDHTWTNHFFHGNWEDVPAPAVAHMYLVKEKIKNRVVKVVKGLEHNMSYDKWLKILGPYSREKRCLCRDLIEVYKI